MLRKPDDTAIMQDANDAGSKGVVSSRVEFVGDGDRVVPARLWRPDADGPFPGVVFLSEAFGLTAEMERLAKMVASWGYIVLAPDLFAQGTWLGCLRRLIRDLRRGGGGTAETLRRARTFLADQPSVDAARLGVLGFCLGGGYALLLARHELFEVAAAFYGEAPARMDGACPVVASYGGRDRIVTPSAAKLRAELERQGVEHDIKVYPDAGHSFMNDAPNPVLGFIAGVLPVHAGYNAPVAADATARVRRFLAGHLGPA